MYVFVLTWEPLSEFLLTASMGNSSDLFIDEAYSGDFFHQLPCQMWKLILKGRVCSVELCCEQLEMQLSEQAIFHLTREDSNRLRV